MTEMPGDIQMAGAESTAVRPTVFVTVGSMFPFDRFVKAVDDWAAGQDMEILAQIGEGAYEPRNMRWVRRLARPEYEAAMAGADLVIAHAGVGSVVSAGEHCKPIVLLPRRHAMAEHTSDHQVETANALRGKAGILVADDETEIPARIDEAMAMTAETREAIARTADPAFIARIRSFILQTPAPGAG